MWRVGIYLLLAATAFATAAADIGVFCRPPEAVEARPVRVVEGTASRAGMVHVPAGPFVMGATDKSDQMPVRRLRVPGFWLDKTEVSAKAYDAFLRSRNKPAPQSPLWIGDTLRPEFADHPAYPVRWADARTYCRAQNKRLPTEVEWEKAARGSAGSAFPWGDEFHDRKANFRHFAGHGDVLSTPVDSLPRGASPYGALHLAGNVREWTADQYRADAYKNRRFTIFPPWLKRPHVLRGGSFATNADQLTGFHRSHSDIDPQNRDYGFRCVADD